MILYNLNTLGAAAVAVGRKTIRIVTDTATFPAYKGQRIFVKIWEILDVRGSGEIQEQDTFRN
ncbi:MAG: hypothetical protein H8D45_13805 [Bacteroidetes bacterium]|nr:hypothetical protein [Bacteroidota bacterium]MBL7104788.1 hypothetical protein [Bacteroidales bacterium]